MICTICKAFKVIEKLKSCKVSWAIHLIPLTQRVLTLSGTMVFQESTFFLWLKWLRFTPQARWYQFTMVSAGCSNISKTLFTVFLAIMQYFSSAVFAETGTQLQFTIGCSTTTAAHLCAFTILYFSCLRLVGAAVVNDWYCHNLLLEP